MNVLKIWETVHTNAQIRLGATVVLAALAIASGQVIATSVMVRLIKWLVIYIGIYYPQYYSTQIVEGVRVRRESLRDLV